MSRKISDALRDTVATHPNIGEVHFTADGHHHFVTPTEIKGKRYTRTQDVYSQVIDPKSGVAAKKDTIGVPATEVVETLSREDILKND